MGRRYIHDVNIRVGWKWKFDRAKVDTIRNRSRGLEAYEGARGKYAGLLTTFIKQIDFKHHDNN